MFVLPFLMITVLFLFSNCQQSFREQKLAQFIFSIDIVDISRRERDYLKEVVENEEIHRPEIIKNAIRRYEKFWMPLRAKYHNPMLVPPKDVEWVWHSHMLRPRIYRNDSMKLSGGHVIDHDHPPNSAVRAIFEGLTRQIWKNTYHLEPFNYMDSWNRFRNSDHKQMSKYNITSACERQKSFANKIINLQPFRRPARLIQGEIQYRKYLYIIAQKYGVPAVPSFDVDLAWHAHQVHPAAYARDMFHNLNHFVDHNDAPAEGETEIHAEATQNVIKDTLGSEEAEKFYEMGSRYQLPLYTQACVRKAFSRMNSATDLMNETIGMSISGSSNVTATCDKKDSCTI